MIHLAFIFLSSNIPPNPDTQCLNRRYFLPLLNHFVSSSSPRQSLRPQTLHARLTHLIKHWPADPVRPASVSIQHYLQGRLPKSPEDKTPLSDSSINALFSLLEDRYSRQYPLPQKLRNPASNPSHYDDVVKEFDEAPQRNWLGRLGKRLKGIVRFR
jgi:cytochrome b pre-mRNA-processing protein 6